MRDGDHYDVIFTRNMEELEDVSWTALRVSEIQVLYLSAPANDVSQQENGTDVFIIINADDYAEILIAGLNDGLGSDTSRFWLSLEVDFVRNTQNIPNTRLLQTEAIQALSFTPDTAVGQLLGSELDMNLGVLTLIFSKPCDISSFIASEILVQDRQTVTIAADGYGTTRGNTLLLTDDGVLLK